jgi:hypothetical protein
MNKKTMPPSGPSQYCKAFCNVAEASRLSAMWPRHTLLVQGALLLSVGTDLLAH